MRAIIISGATATGKSSLALDFSVFKDVAIINADALQIYKGLPILSAQPSVEDKKIASHLLYSHFEFEQNVSVMNWLKLIKTTVEEVFAQNKIPLIVGGSGMYISKLLDVISEIAEISDENKREARNLYQEIGKEKFVETLLKMGENDSIKNLDKQRLIRLYEVLKQTKKTLSAWQEQPKKFVLDPKIFTHINLEIEREKLYKNCNLRFEKMLENGAIEEVRALISQGVKDEMQISKTLGFFEIRDFLEGKISHAKALEISSQKTRNYAKRQLTWFRHQFKNKVVFSDAKAALEFLKKF